MANVLELIQSACYEIGITPPSSGIYNTTDPDFLHLKNLLITEARTLRAEFPWPQQKKKYSFDTTTDRTKYPLPQDFWGMSADTQWDRDKRLPLNGLVSDYNMQERLYFFDSSPGATFGFRIFGPDGNAATSGGQLELDTSGSVTSGITLSYEYLTKNLFLPKPWVSGASAAASSYVSANGNIYSTSAGGTNGATIPSHTTGSASDGGVTWVYVSTPYESILADTDTCLFDDDICIKGIVWRYRKGKDTAFDQDYAEYLDLKTTAKTRWNGSKRGSFLKRDNWKVGPVIPSRGWVW